MKSHLFKCISRLALVCIILIVYQGVTIAGTTGKISGEVKDASTGELLYGTNVVIVGTTMGAAADLNGSFFIINVPPGTYSIRASMMGYETVTQTGVMVSADHTTPLNFNLRGTTIAGQEVTVVAEREIIPMDVSASQIVAEAAEIIEVPLVTDLSQYIGLQAGIEGQVIRGGGLDQTSFMVDGLMMVDNRSNQPVMMINLSAVKELSIIKGGFNAEYGNVRSGVINVITKEGSPSQYNGSIDFRISPSRIKHSGSSLFSPDNYYLRPYLDPGVMWVGTQNGTWSEEKQKQNIYFMGWNAYSEGVLSDGSPDNDMTPEQARDLFLWQHRAEGSGKLGQKEGEYGNKPDWNLDASFGGPVPLIGKYLGRLTFFASHRTNWETFALPTTRDYYKEANSLLKLTSHISPSMKLTFDGGYGAILSVARYSDQNNAYVRNGMDIMHSTPLGSNYQTLYSPQFLNPFNIYRDIQGLSFDHVLSRRTFYNLRISRVHVVNDSYPNRLRNKEILRYFGTFPVDEQPYGGGYVGEQLLTVDGMYIGAHGNGQRDDSRVSTIAVKFDLVSQINRTHQVKVGFDATYDDMYTHYERIRPEVIGSSFETKWSHFPIRVGAYAQDKIEFEGLIANVGLRLDYNEPNTDWYELEPYDKYFRYKWKNLLTTEAPKKDVNGHLKISPRLGISHPISENAKIYFNYGHFYSMPSSTQMYDIDYGKPVRYGGVQGIAAIGDPTVNLPRTISYELGTEYNILDMFYFHLSGYYKDVSDQISSVQYTSFDTQIDYSTIDNRNYADIRGFELRIDKRFGEWITGWINYNYMVSTSGYVGRNHYYEDLRSQAIYGLQNPYQQKPLARPFARALINIKSPEDFGPEVAGMRPLADIFVSVLAEYKAGSYMTWDPLETYTLRSNLQWKSNYNVDLRLSKMIKFGRHSITLFADINNLFNFKYISGLGFVDAMDRQQYIESLHLPMYDGEEYKEAGYTGGDDKLGDVKSDDKPYIDMPNRDMFTYLNQRSVFFGFKYTF